MTTRKFGLIMAVACVAVCIRAAERTWTGGGGDAKWSTPANWGGTAPTANDTLVFSGAAYVANTNDLADDTPFAGITFSGTSAFTLNGKRIILGGDVTNLSAGAQTVNLPIALQETRVFNSSNGAITVNGALSGAGGLTKTGPQTLTLTASNSYDGVTTVNNGMLAITHDFALGSTNGDTLVNSKSVAVGGGFLQLSGNITVREPLRLFGERNAPTSTDRSSILNLAGTNTLSGPIIRTSGGNNTRIHLRSGTRLNITGGITGGNSQLFVIRFDSGTLAISGKPINIGTDNMWLETTGTLLLGATGNVWGSNPNFDSSNLLRMEIPDALAPGSAMALGFSATGSLTLDLNGFDQRIGNLFTRYCTSGTRIIKTDAPATLTADQNVDTHLDARLTGPLSLFKTGTGTLTLSNSVANTTTTTGSITVTNGTLRVAANNNLGNATNILVSGGILDLRAAENIKDSARLAVLTNGQVNIGAGIFETVGTLFIDGTQQQFGTWGTTASGAAHTDDIHFAGTGKVYVQNGPAITVTDATWDAEGPNTLVSTAANWTDDALPLFNGTARAIFATGGSTATVDTAVSLNGIIFNATNAFTVDSADNTVTLGPGGIAAAIPDTTSRAYTLAGIALLGCNQPWSVTTNLTGVTTLNVSAELRDGADPFGIAKSGNGNLVLSGNNSYDGVTYLNEGTITISHNNALGSTNGPTLVSDGALIEMQGGIAVAEALSLPSDASTRFGGGLRVTGGSNLWSGKITSSLSNSRIKCNAGSLDITGGIEGGQICLGGDAGKYLRVTGQPINTPNNTVYVHTSIPIIFDMTNNRWIALSINGHFVRTDLDNIFPPASALELGSVAYSPTPGGLDLNGHSQTVKELKSYDVGSTLVVFSPTPATLTVNQDTATALYASITGAVTLVKAGSGSLALTRTNATSGGYVVSNGTLAVSSTGTLGVNSTNVVVAGGTLSLSNSVAVADAATLTIADGGAAKVHLAPGVNESVGRLYFSGKQQRAGTYSATGGSGVQVIDTAHFAGSGVLRVLHDNAGTLISVR